MKNPIKGKHKKKSTYRVVRGGCWRNSAQFLRVAGRSGVGPSGRNRNLGFRIVRSKDEKSD